MSLGFRAESTNTSGVITVAGVDQVVINNAGDVAATTFTGALVGNASTATKLSTATGAAPSYGCRAFVNFSGSRDESNNISTANTNRLMYSNGNVSSVLRTGLGLYTVNFSVAMPNANYCVVFGTSSTGAAAPVLVINQLVAPTVSALAIEMGDLAARQDVSSNNVAIFI
jgi:hypothetical protein